MKPRCSLHKVLMNAGVCDACHRMGYLIVESPHNTTLNTNPVKTDSQARKNSPVFSGLMQYFPDALMAISQHSKRGNDKHNPGQPMHWAKEKSTDHADCIARHLIDIGANWDQIDPETGSYHAAALAWRALALLQTVLERDKKE